MRNLNSLFADKKINFDKLAEYGFEQKGNTFVLKENILDDSFRVVIAISSEQQTAQILDLQADDEFVLADIPDAVGAFVGSIRAEVDKIVQGIIEKCTTTEIFKTKQAKAVIDYVKQKYADDLEFLWQKFPKNAIFRNKTNQKWYLALLTVPQNRLGGASTEPIEILDLRYQKETIKEIVDNATIFPGYHMNKNSWITIPLDDRLPTNQICHLIDNSYILSLKK